MARTLKSYLASHPAPNRHQKAGEKTAVKRNPMSAGWAWKPDAATKRALSRGSRKIAKAKRAALNPEEMENEMATSKKASAKKKRTSKKKVRRVSKKKTAKKVAKKTTGNRIPLKKICQELKIEPKMARRKLRAANLSGHDSQSRWEFTAAQAKKAKEILAA